MKTTVSILLGGPATLDFRGIKTVVEARDGHIKFVDRQGNTHTFNGMPYTIYEEVEVSSLVGVQ